MALTSASKLVVGPRVALVPVRAAHPGAAGIAAEDEGPEFLAAPETGAATHFHS